MLLSHIQGSSHSHESNKLGAAYLYVSPRQDELTSWDISMRIMQFMTSLTLRSIIRPELINLPMILAFGSDPTSGITSETITFGIAHLVFQLGILGHSGPYQWAVHPISDLMPRWRASYSIQGLLFLQAAALEREFGHWSDEECLLLKCESLYRQAQDHHGCVITLYYLSYFYMKSDNIWMAREKFAEAVAIQRQLQDDEGGRIDLYILGETYRITELMGSFAAVSAVIASFCGFVSAILRYISGQDHLLPSEL
jgi:hypothetical protein